MVFDLSSMFIDSKLMANGAGESEVVLRDGEGQQLEWKSKFRDLNLLQIVFNKTTKLSALHCQIKKSLSSIHH